ncbi:MAG TPA: carbamoyltransferase C-terminal domain-containing protein [Bryobacteraceae bacterium]|jgi:carbamoyltransferase|nr:carbamoyltransferase C-terminal domain-containing protein [Bryobacteraceae bacterium]
MSVFVGIHDGHNASVAVVRDGRIELALQEERLTRIKNQGDAPARAARLAFQMLNGDGANARIGLNGLYMNYHQWERTTILRDYDRSADLVGRWKQSFKGTFVDRAYQKSKADLRVEALSEIGVPADRMEPVEHHLAHASAAYHTAPWKDEKVLVLTCDGAGDRLSATVSIGEHGTISRLASVSEHDSIGRLYALVTRYLGMAPLEHEYKVMGLAPYVARGSRVESSARDFSGLFVFSADGLSWKRRAAVPSMYSAYGFIKILLAGKRFDTIAAGVQKFIEDMLVRWVSSAVRETGIRKVACGGGVFMNVKANLALLEIPEVEDLYVFPSCGDESNSIGAACHLAAQTGEKIQAPGALYYGEPITDGEAQLVLESIASPRVRFRVERDIERVAAEKLAEGKVVARAKGAVEFGARALGNRSILARADSPTAVREINEMVKNRDFWMPFGPSVLSERATDYYEKPKPVLSPYMMFGFRSRPEKRAVFGAALHPYDFTTRPQEVLEVHNPDYYRLLQEYEGRTGEGILLNTSFNLHGEPIVYRACDAVKVFLESGLRYMALGNWWVEKI